MNIDLTAAARAYGLTYVPPVVQMLPDDDNYYNEAYFLYTDKTIYIGSLFNDDNTDDYSEQRFMVAGAPRLNEEDARKFILAHELWHARQWEMDPTGAREQTLKENMAALLGDHDAHDRASLEREADKHAAQVYKLVRITQ